MRVGSKSGEAARKSGIGAIGERIWIALPRDRSAGWGLAGCDAGLAVTSLWEALQMPFSIREATKVDADPIVGAYQWLFESPGAAPPGWDEEQALEAVSEAIESDRSVIFVAISSSDSKLVGICSAYLDLRSVRYGLRCWVEDLAVAPEMRSRGIGEDLLAEARTWASRHGATHLELDTGEQRKDAQRFYGSLGPDQRTVAYGWRL